MKNALAGASFGLALLAAGYLLVFPIYSGSNATQQTHATLLQVNGPHALIPVLFPVLITLITLLLGKWVFRVAATILIGLFVLIGGFTIGLFYLPAAILMWMAACVDDPSRFRH
jgi:hypothetical protein